MKQTYRVKKRKRIKKKRPKMQPKKKNWFQKILLAIGIAYFVALIYLLGIFFLTKPTNTVQLGYDPVEEVKEKLTITDKFVEDIIPIAKEMQRNYQVLPSIIIGQAILESNSGQSELGKDYYNLFGIKAHGESKQIELETKEFIDGRWVVVKTNFRVYDSWNESIRDHTNLFVEGVSWDADLYKPVLEAETYDEAARALQEAGYATDPKYSEKLIDVIKAYELNKYDE